MEKLHITELTLMQQNAYDSILHGKDDVIVLSPTGSGKTLAYMLPLAEMTDADSDMIQTGGNSPKPRVGTTVRQCAP